MGSNPDRLIPHVWDIFGLKSHSSSKSTTTGVLQQVNQQDRYGNYKTGKDKLKSQKNPENDSAVSVGSSDEEDHPNHRNKSKKKKKERNKRNATANGADPLQNTDREVHHLERHLSMKKTIRKKIMRDLQQAFVEDPTEFTTDPEQIPAERKAGINLDSLSIGQPRSRRAEPTFLDMLRGGEKDRHQIAVSMQPTSGRNCYDTDSGNGSPTREDMRAMPIDIDKLFQECNLGADLDSPSSPEPHASSRNKNGSSFWKVFGFRSKAKR